MRFLPIIVIMLLLDAYVFQAIQVVMPDWPLWAAGLVYGLYWSIPVVAVGMLLAANFRDVDTWNKHFFTLLRTILFIAYVSKMVVGGILLLDDLRRLVMASYDQVAGLDMERNRSLAFSQLGLLLGAVPFVSLIYGILRNPYRYKLFREVVRINGLPPGLHGLKIIQLSDIHSGSFTRKAPLGKAIELINREQADLVLFTGDLVNNMAVEIHDYLSIFDKITAKYGVYSVLGNHDYGDYVQWRSSEDKRRNLEQLKAAHQRMGWNLLLNENRILSIEGASVAVIGVENYSGHPRFPKYGDLARAHRGTDGAALKLLLSHDPSHWESQVTHSYPDIDITFSGHTHGMQFGVEIPGLFRWSPIQYVYKQWAGLYRKGEQFLYVNRGFGFLGYPGRVGILPEITVMEIQSK